MLQQRTQSGGPQGRRLWVDEVSGRLGPLSGRGGFTLTLDRQASHGPTPLATCSMIYYVLGHMARYREKDRLDTAAGSPGLTASSHYAKIEGKRHSV